MVLSSQEYNRESFILIVDDDNTLLKFFKIHLNKFFSKIIVVENAKDALKKLKETNIDLVISDIRMPKVDGLELMEKVKKYDPSIPTLLVSGALLDAEKLEAVAKFSDGFLKKPFTIEQLHEFIEMGMRLRLAYAELTPMAKSKKTLRALLDHQMSPEEAIKKADLLKATEILSTLKKAG
ncbi:MAG: response regulator [Oligoflexales bacterium]|nr:response regulator [Oligoflexales bacterium]